MSGVSIRTGLAGVAIAAAILLSPLAQAQSAASDFTSAKRYDAAHRVTGTIAPDPDGAGPLHHAAVRNSYDAAGRLVKQEKGELAAWQPTETAPANWAGFTIFGWVDSVYDAMGHKLRDTMWANGSGGAIVTGVTQYSYDIAGRLECTAVRMNPAVYASLPASACTLGTAGSQGPDRITHNVYDPFGQLLKVQKAYGVTTTNGFPATLQQDYASYSYSPNGKQTQVIDADGNVATMSYDGLDRQVRWSFPDKTTIGAVSANDYEAYGYDANGNRLTLRKRDGTTITLRYDALNRVVQKRVPDAATGATASATANCNATLNLASDSNDICYGYDLQGRQLYARFGHDGGAGLSTGYDAVGRLASSSVTLDGVTRTLKYDLDPDGNRTQLTYPDLTVFAYDYDGLDRQTTIREPGGAAVASVTYDNQGRRTRLDRVGAYTSYGYDDPGRLRELKDDQVGTGSDLTSTFSYNAASQLIGNLRDNNAYVYGGEVAVTRQYAVNGLNQYVTAGPATFGYDDNGNLTSDGSTTFNYDRENRLISASGSKTAALRYDPMGRLYETVGTVNGGTVTTRFLYDGDELVAEYDSAGTMLKRYVHGPSDDDPLLWYEGASLATRRQIFTDHQGSVVSIADGSGNNIAINTYDEWGVPGASNSGRFQYTGQAWIAELGMYYYKARFYSPTLGRFMQTDPIGYKDQMNLYMYVGDDPVDGRDPSGEQSVEETLVNAVKNVPGALIETANSINRVFLGIWSDDPSQQPTTRDYINTAMAVASIPAPEARVAAVGEVAEVASVARVSSRSLTVEQAGAGLAQQAGTNRVSVMTPSGRMSIDLAGKAHFDKASGTEVPTPHVKMQALNIGPGGRTNLTHKAKTTAATMQDIRTARKIIERRRNNNE